MYKYVYFIVNLQSLMFNMHQVKLWFSLRLNYLRVRRNKTGLQPVSRPVELVHYFGGWVECPSKQRDRTDGGLVQSTFGAKAEQIELAFLCTAIHLLKPLETE